MMVRCGACRAGFDVSGPGRHVCPACGATNQVGGGPPAGAAPPVQSPASPLAGAPPAAPAPPPIDISRVRCGECDFEFIVGEVDTAACPNCRAEVHVGAGGGDSE